MSLNKVLIIGNLGSDPEIRFMPSGKQVAQFSVAANRRYKLEGQMKEETEWFAVVAFGRLAEISSEFLKKGKSVFVEGRLRTRSWADAAGTKHYRTEVIAESFTMIGKRNGDQTQNAAVSETDEEHPF